MLQRLNCYNNYVTILSIFFIKKKKFFLLDESERNIINKFDTNKNLLIKFYSLHNLFFKIICCTLDLRKLAGSFILSLIFHERLHRSFIATNTKDYLFLSNSFLYVKLTSVL